MDTRLRSPTGRDTGKLLHCPLILSKMQVTYRFTWPSNATRHRTWSSCVSGRAVTRIFAGHDSWT